MSRALTWINLLGVAALAVLCTFQWRADRALTLGLDTLEQTRRAQSAQLAEQARTLQGLTADLERFRAQLATTTLGLKESETKLRASEQLAAALTRERDQLKESVARWAAAVAARDERIRDANGRITDLGTRLNDSIANFNALVSKYNDLLRQLNDPSSHGDAALSP